MIFSTLTVFYSQVILITISIDNIEIIEENERHLCQVILAINLPKKVALLYLG